MVGEVGVAADSVNLYLDRVHVVASQGGGLTIANGSLVRLRNCFIGGNGVGEATSPGVRVTAWTLYFTYTTVAGNDAAMEDSLVCNVASSVTARNSIFLGHDYYSIDCGPFTATHSMFDEVIVGDGNDAVFAIEDNWFVDASAGDLHLTAERILRFLNIARWDAGDPPIDIDGDLRPNEPGTTDLPVTRHAATNGPRPAGRRPLVRRTAPSTTARPSPPKRPQPHHRRVGPRRALPCVAQ